MITQDSFIKIRDIVATCKGPEKAATIDEIASWSGVRTADNLPNRRTVEQILETRYADFGFPICSGARGIFIPADVEQLNHYVTSLTSRIRCIGRRIQNVYRAAEKSGFKRENGRFVAKPVQTAFKGENGVPWN